MDDIFGPLTESGLIQQYCSRCFEPMPGVVGGLVFAAEIEVKQRVPTGTIAENRLLCPTCMRELRAWLGVVTR